MAATWPLSRIRAKVRSLTGRPSTSQTSDNDIDDMINDFYVNTLPGEFNLPDTEGFYSFSTVADTGEYTVPAYIIDIRDFTIDDGDADVVDPLTLWHDRSAFFHLYPEDDSRATQKPFDILRAGEQFYLRPIPDDTYTVKGWASQRPTTELASDSSLPLQSSWGEFIAYGAAIKFAIELLDTSAVNDLTGRKFGYNDLKNVINRKRISQLIGVRAKPVSTDYGRDRPPNYWP